MVRLARSVMAMAIAGARMVYFGEADTAAPLGNTLTVPLKTGPARAVSTDRNNPATTFVDYSSDKHAAATPAHSKAAAMWAGMLVTPNFCRRPARSPALTSPSRRAWNLVARGAGRPSGYTPAGAIKAKNITKTVLNAKMMNYADVDMENGFTKVMTMDAAKMDRLPRSVAV